MKMRSKYVFHIACFCLAVLAATYLLNRLVWRDTVRALTEAVCVLGSLILFLSVKDIRRLWTSISVYHRAFITCFFLCLFVAHFFGLRRFSFPFLSWDVFNEQHLDDTIVRHRFVGITDDGSAVPILPAGYFLSLQHGRLPSLLQSQIEVLVHTRKLIKKGEFISKDEMPPAQGMKRAVRVIREWVIDDLYMRPTEEQKKELRLTLKAILKRHNATYPEKKFVALEAHRLVRDFYQKGKVRQKEVIMRVTAGGD